MSQAIGIAQPVISRVASGKQQPGSRFLEALAAHPKVNPMWLHTGDGDPLLESHGAATAAGWPIPVAGALLPGPPADYPELLTARVEYVPGVLYRETVYAVEAANCVPAILDSSERLFPTDLIVIDTDASRWRGNVQFLNGRLCAVANVADDVNRILLQRVYVDDAEPSELRLREHADPRHESIEGVYGKRFRLIRFKGEEEECAPKPELEPLSPLQVAGASLQLIRAL
jgi:hypothetical protein